MDITRENILKLIVKTESTKCANCSDFEHSSFLSSSKSHNLII